MARTIKCPRVIAHVRRSVMQIQPVDVPAHEILILGAMFGEDRVHVIKASNSPPLVIDADTEYERMQRKYGIGGEDQGGQEWVLLVFGRRQEGRLRDAMIKGLDLFEQPTVEDETDVEQGAQEVDESNETDWPSDEAEWPTKAEILRNLDEIKAEVPNRKARREELLGVLEINIHGQLKALGVEYDKTLPLSALNDMLGAAKEQLAA